MTSFAIIDHATHRKPPRHGVRATASVPVFYAPHQTKGRAYANKGKAEAARRLSKMARLPTATLLHPHPDVPIWLVRMADGAEYEISTHRPLDGSARPRILNILDARTRFLVGAWRFSAAQSRKIEAAIAKAAA